MTSCEFCGKEFKFPYLLVRHLNRVTSCSMNKPQLKNLENSKKIEEKVNDIQEKVIVIQEKVNSIQEKVNSSNCKFQCEKCEKTFTSKQSLNYHSNICKGVNSLQCPTCFKTFSNKVSKCRHIKNSKCSPPMDQCKEDQCKQDLEEEIETLRKENAILKATSRGRNTTNNVTNNNNNITNYTIKYEIKYNPETKCITSDDPNAPFPELLCFNGFKHEAAKSKLKYIDKDTLTKCLDNVRHSDDYYGLYTFFFRNVDNQRLHMFNMGKSSNSTHAEVFNNGSLEKMHKATIFENVSKYIGQYLLNMSVDNLDIINKVLTDQKSKDAFIEVMRDKSHTFNYYRGSDDKDNTT